MDLFDFNHDGEVSDLERIIGLAAVLSETNPDVEISVTVGEDEDYGRELVSFRGMDLSRRETIAEVSDWSIRFELSKKSCSMYLFEIDTVSFENAGQPRRVYLRRCSSSDDLDFIRAVDPRKHQKYPNQLAGRGRYSEQKHCCVFSHTAIMIAQETGCEDDWQE